MGGGEGSDGELSWLAWPGGKGGSWLCVFLPFFLLLMLRAMILPDARLGREGGTTSGFWYALCCWAGRRGKGNRAPPRVPPAAQAVLS